jgi:V-type H+-transporting ATPase subunit C
MATEYILVAFPNGSEGVGSTMKSLEKAVASSEANCAEVFHFEVPTMRVGTLEKLMAAGDALAKVDSSVEAVIRKIERALQELNEANDELMVDGGPVVPYLEHFRWATAKYQATRPVEELVKLITQSVQKIDDELKEAMTAYQESKHELNALQRKKGGNLMANVSEYIKDVDPNVFFDTEYLTTVMIVVSKNAEKQFLEQYEGLAPDAVGYGPAENRQEVLGSPVVPGSAQKIAEDKDGFILYVVTILKNFKDVFTHACQKARFAVRDPASEKKEADTAPEDEDESPEARFTAAEIHFNECKNQLRRWAKTHYGEAFIAWMHIKTIRVFVEAVLLYGLPVDFAAFLIKPKKKAEKKLRERLVKLYSAITGNDTSATEVAGSSASREAYYPYVSFSFKPFAAE